MKFVFNFDGNLSKNLNSSLGFDYRLAWIEIKDFRFHDLRSNAASLNAIYGCDIIAF